MLGRTRAIAGGVLAGLVLVGCGGRVTPQPPPPPRRVPDLIPPRRVPDLIPPRRVPDLIPPANARPRTVRVPVLTYHRVVPLSAFGLTPLKVDPANFAAELAALHHGGYHTVSQAQLFAALYRGGALPARPVLLSFDDGYVDAVRTVLPTLQRWRMVATFFVITGRTSMDGFLSQTQIRALDRAGMDVGDHTAHHVDLRRLTPGQLNAETAGSRQELQRVLGHPVYYFAYPFGAYNQTVVSAVRRAGFTMAYTTDRGIEESSAMSLTMPRTYVLRAQTPAGLIGLLGRN